MTGAPETWERLARSLRGDLPGRWTLRGPGSHPFLVREPVDWTIAWVGHRRRGSHGTLSAGVLPLVEPFTGWHLEYGTVMDDVVGGPRTLDLDSPEALGVARAFVLGHALEILGHWSLERIAETAEARFAARPDDPRGGGWTVLPGCRVVLATGSPEEAARRLAGPDPEDREYYGGLANAWRAGGREAALRFLRRHRDDVLRGEQVDRARS
ncbi:hypothetical protein ACWGH8_35275 [Nonomuraea muscovyensis]